MKKPVRYHGYLHTLPKNDKRIKKYRKQLKKRGFDDTELWNLDETFVRFIAPRLNAFEHACPDPEFQRKLKLAKRVFNFLNSMENYYDPLVKAGNKEIDEGLQAFSEIFFHLWT